MVSIPVPSRNPWSSLFPTKTYAWLLPGVVGQFGRLMLLWFY